MKFGPLDAFPPALVVAQAAAGVDVGWGNALLNSGALGLWVIYLVWRDKREGEKADKRHEDNLAQQKRVEEAFRSTTTAVITTMAGLQNLDESYSRLLKKIEEANETHI